MPSSQPGVLRGDVRCAQAAFGDALKGVEQVDAVETSATAAAVDAHLDMLRPAITSYGASVQVRVHALAWLSPALEHARRSPCSCARTPKS